MTDSVEPSLVLIKGDATAEEVAALITVLQAVAASSMGKALPPAPKSNWAAPSRLVRRVHQHGPGGWRASGLPH